MGPAMTELFGPARTVIIYTIGGVAGFRAELVRRRVFCRRMPFLHGAGFTVGASAPVFGLIGALYHYGRTAAASPSRWRMSIMIQAVIFGLLVQRASTTTRTSADSLGGYLTSAFLNPMTRERGDHMIIALGASSRPSSRSSRRSSPACRSSVVASA